MPQLDTNFFLPQIFWILIGFVLVYAFVSNVAAPKLQKLLDERSGYVNKLDSRAQMLAVEAEKLTKESRSELQKVQDEALRSEAAFAMKLSREGELFKKDLRLKYAEKIDEKSRELKKQSDGVFQEISTDIDSIVADAANAILGKSK